MRDETRVEAVANIKARLAILVHMLNDEPDVEDDNILDTMPLGANGAIDVTAGQVRRALADLAALAAADAAGWCRDMSAAPKIGPFLAYWPGGGPYHIPLVGVRLTWQWNVSGHWLFTGHDTMGPDPTAWRPLPAPPEAG